MLEGRWNIFKQLYTRKMRMAVPSVQLVIGSVANINHTLHVMVTVIIKTWAATNLHGATPVRLSSIASWSLKAQDKNFWPISLRLDWLRLCMVYQALIVLMVPELNLEYSCNKYSNLIGQLEVHYFTYGPRGLLSRSNIGVLAIF